MDLTDPVAFALDIAEVLHREGVDHALYGGLLLAAYGQARETKDADLAVVHADPAATSSLLADRLGLHCTVAFDRRPYGGLFISRITMIQGDDLNTLDLVEPRDRGYAERALARSLVSELREREIRVLTPEDFVVFKALSTRDLDVEDAASVVRAMGSDLATELVEREIEELSQSPESHAARERWLAIRARHRDPSGS